MIGSKGRRATYAKTSAQWRYWGIIVLFSALATALFIISVMVKSPSSIQRLSQAIGEALVVAIVVSLAVEPRLLRYFGEEIASQTFWNSFYSRAPDTYREAIKELASAGRFTIAVDWGLTFDWVDSEKAAIRLTAHCDNHLENRGSKPYPLEPLSFVYESAFPGLMAEFHTYSAVCQESVFYVDFVETGLAKIEHANDGRLLVKPERGHHISYFQVPPGQRYTYISGATTYVGSTGHFPLVMATPVLRFTLQLGGTALSDLYMSVMHPSQGSYQTVIEGTGKELSEKARFEVGAVSITGQAVLLSWKASAK